MDDIAKDIIDAIESGEMEKARELTSKLTIKAVTHEVQKEIESKYGHLDLSAKFPFDLDEDEGGEDVESEDLDLED